MKQESKMTWQELKEFVNALPENELSKIVRWWGDERGGVISYAQCLKEDLVLTEEGWEPKAAIMEDVEMYPPDEVEEMEHMRKGSPVLYTDF